MSRTEILHQQQELAEKERRWYDWRKLFFFLEHLHEEEEISETSYHSLSNALQTFKPELEE